MADIQIDKDLLALLYKKIKEEALSSEEESQLHQWAQRSAGHEELMRLLSDDSWLQKEVRHRYELNPDAAWERLRQRHQPVVSRIHFLRRGFVRYAAAVIFVAAAVGGYFFLHYQPASGNNVPPPLSAHAIDVAPGGDKAMLTLAGGQRILLDDVGKGELTRQGGTIVQKTDSGRLVYAHQGGVSPAVLYNTLRTPRGGQYQLVLPDGTRVWLNAASAITYPTDLSGTDRTVTVQGEAYFEVAKDKARPFRVKIDSHVVEVLGTSFNVNAYADEPGVQTTLVEGSVRIGQQQLRPGQQAQWHAGNTGHAVNNGQANVEDRDIRVLSQVDMAKVTAWKNGLFAFDHSDMPSLMRQIARWYDVDIVYEGPMREHAFTGNMVRAANLSKVLKILELGGVRFRLEGKKLLVRP